jgi:hypothetical protein
MTRIRARWRRASALYLAVFLLAVAVAPHHHINGLEDLLLDQPSDSGAIIETGQHEAPIAPSLTPFWIVDDVPCLACFTSDFVAAPGHAFALDATLERLSLPLQPPPKPSPDEIPRETSSRAPPSLS